MPSPHTIAAIATAPGEAAIGLVRLSGPGAADVAGRLFHVPDGRPFSDLVPRYAYLGEIRDPATGRTVDQVLLTLFRGPHSYTGEDVVEITAHGGPVPLRRILTLALAHGARPAEPGEYTLRAFLNGKLDLAQAEAVIEVIHARTEQGLGLAVRQLEGRLSAQVRGARDTILPLVAHIEATIDFPEDVPEMAPAEIAERLDAAHHTLHELLAGAHAGRIYREGVRVVIVGCPNVGKSSLLNAILREERAIVTDIPGTTRDVIEESANIRGIPLRAIDTAGIRDPRDPVEAIGVRRTLDQLAGADLILAVVDASRPLADGDREVLAHIQGRPCVVIANKCDLPDCLEEEAIREAVPGAPIVRVSAREAVGIAALEDAVAHLVLGGAAGARDEALVSSARHQAALEAACASLDRARDTLAAGLPLELMTTDLRDALDALAQVTGEAVSDTVIADIFSRFCIGK